jgi:hypothetical protein
MVRQVKNFTQRRLGDALRLRDLPVDMSALLIAIKVAFLELEQVIANTSSAMHSSCCKVVFLLPLSRTRGIQSHCIVGIQISLPRHPESSTNADQ